MTESDFYLNITLLDNLNVQLDVLISEELLQLFRLVNYVIITGPVSVFGILFNIINIVVFVKIGFRDTVNISLLSLAVSDLVSILPLVWMSVSFNPLLALRDRSMDFQAIQVVVGWPHVCFSRITSCLTAFISVERYLCVALPLKIRAIITPRRTLTIIVLIFVFGVSGVVPEYFSFQMYPYTETGLNLTLIGIRYNSRGRQIENFVLSFATFCQLTSFLLVTLATIGLVRTLQRKSEWRQSKTSAVSYTGLSVRDRRTMQMIVSISVIFIASYLPLSVSLVGMLCYKEYNIQGRYNNLLIGTATIFLCLESINSSVNIFVYYNMSSKYRAVFLSTFRIQRQQ